MKHFWQNIEGWVGDNATYRMALDRAKDGQHFVEIGVYKGRSAAFMAVELANRGLKVRFDAIDHFGGSEEHGDLSKTLYNECVQNLKSVAGYVNVIRMNSLEAADLYEDSSLDFIFIDGSHDYNSVTSDLSAWYPKIKETGIFAGDDYQPGYWPGVIAAVENFARFNGLKLELIPDTYHWMLVKE
jgi:predicted O-methyltransferase YrrM